MITVVTEPRGGHSRCERLAASLVQLRSTKTEVNIQCIQGPGSVYSMWLSQWVR